MKAHHNYTIPCGLILAVIGLIIRYYIGKRRFDRRGMAGLQQFTTYGNGVFTTLWETLFLFIGNLFLSGGLFLLALAGFNHFKFLWYENEFF